MTIAYQVLIGDPLNEKKRQQIQEMIEGIFALVDTHFNCWNPDSEISQLNRAAGGTVFPLSAELRALLERVATLVSLTEGRFDPTVAPMIHLWRAALERGDVPSRSAIEQVRSITGWDHLRLEGGSCIKDHDHVALDLCGIAKGYAVDLIAGQLKKVGFHNFHISWGGEIRATGCHPSGRAWNAAIAAPDKSGVLATIPLHEEAVATSGDYEQQWEVEGQLYTHIYRQPSGSPLQSVSGSVTSATVIAPECWMADGLATAAMLISSPEEGQLVIRSWEESLPGVHLLLLYR